MRTSRSFRAILSAVFLVFASIVCTFCGLTGALAAFSGSLIGPADWLTRVNADEEIAVVWRPSNGDIFSALPGQVRPPADDTPYTNFTIAWDADSFRKPAQEYPTHPIAIFGDSFTEGYAVAVPYAERLASLLDTGVQNYGYRAYGPQEVAQVAQEFAGKEPREWLIWGYFSGNDMGDAMRTPRYALTDPLGLWRGFLARHLPPAPPVAAENDTQHYNQPLPVIIGANYYEMAFVGYYGAWQQLDASVSASPAYQRVAETLDAVRAAADPKTCLALLFIPPKEVIYSRYIYPTERVYIYANNTRVTYEDGDLSIVPAPVTLEEEDAHLQAMYAHRDLLREMAGTAGWLFIDMTPVLEQAAAEGALLYYPYDTHWMQAGHDLTAETLAVTLRDMPDCAGG